MARRPASRGFSRPLRIGLWSLAAVIGLAAVGGAIFVASFDPDSLKPRIEAAVKQATGRDLTLQGRIRLGLSLQPTLTIQGAGFANPPGFSRPAMATLDRLDLKLSLIPLLSRRIEIDRLVLVKLDILLETDTKGRHNWQFTPTGDTTAPAATAPSAPDTAQPGTPTRISVAAVRIEDGTVTWRDDAANRSTVVGIKSLDASAASPDANLQVAAAATYNGAPITVSGMFGTLARLQNPADRSPWPVQLSLEAGGAKLTADGTLTQPLEGRGYTAKLTATIPDLPALSPFLPGTRLPALRDVSLAAQVADTGGKLPDISDLVLHVGPSDLTATAAGLKLEKLDVTAAKLDKPVQIAGQGSFDGAPAALTGTVGVPAGLLSGAVSGPVPVDLAAHALGSAATFKGTIASGAAGRISLRGEMKADTIDADRLRAAVAKAPPEPVAAAAGVPRAAPPAAPPASAPPARPARDGRMIPDTPIPFERLRAADADLTINIGALKSGAAAYRAVAAHVVLLDGQLRVDPFAADLPEGHLDGALTADARQPAPPVTLRLHAPGVALQPLLAALGEPAYASGRLEVYADLNGAGATPHAIAAGLDGALGLAMANGSIDNRLLGSRLGTIVRDASLLDLVGRGGNSQIECLAVRIDASHGVGTLRTLLLRSSLLSLEGDGSVNLGAETLDLRIRPEARVAGAGVVVPLHVTGPFRAPSAVPDPAAAAVANAGTVAGLALRGATPFGAIAGALGGERLLGGGTGGTGCGPALAIARGQQTGAPARPAGQPAPAAQPAPPPKPPNAGTILRQLFR